MSDDERADGFDVMDFGLERPLVAKRFGDDTLVVKTCNEKGEVEYAICDVRFEPLFIVATSLSELRERFR